MTQYVGKVDSTSNPFAGTSYTPVPGTGDMSFSVSLDGDGKFKSLVHKSGLSPFQKNLIKGWAASLQINSGEIKSGKKAFKSTEVSNSTSSGLLVPQLGLICSIVFFSKPCMASVTSATLWLEICSTRMSLT